MSLSANDIYYVDNLPKNLRQLDLILTGLGSNNKASNFPEGLEKLDISGNAIDGEWLKRLNIKQLPNLKDLSIRDNQAILLDPRDLPPSLAVLDINGDFMHLLNLILNVYQILNKLISPLIMLIHTLSCLQILKRNLW